MTPAQALCSPEVADRLAAMAEVAVQGDAGAAVLDALAACLGETKKILQRRAAETFAALDARGVIVRPVLLRALESDAARQRWGAAYALSLLGDTLPVALPVLVEALGSDDGDVRWAAGNILACRRGDDALIAVLQRLVRTGNAAQRKMAAYCLRDLDARSVVTERALLAALHDPDTNVRLAAISCLARLALDRAAAAHSLIALLQDADVSVRRVTAAVLGLLGERSEAVHAALALASRSSDASLARAAAHSLRVLAAR